MKTKLRLLLVSCFLQSKRSNNMTCISSSVSEDISIMSLMVLEFIYQIYRSYIRDLMSMNSHIYQIIWAIIPRLPTLCVLNLYSKSNREFHEVFWALKEHSLSNDASVWVEMISRPLYVCTQTCSLCSSQTDLIAECTF